MLFDRFKGPSRVIAFIPEELQDVVYNPLVIMRSVKYASRMPVLISTSLYSMMVL